MTTETETKTKILSDGLFFVEIAAMCVNQDLLQVLLDKQEQEEDKDKSYDKVDNVVSTVKAILFEFTGQEALLKAQGAVLECIKPQWKMMVYLLENKDTIGIDETVKLLVLCCRILGANKHRLSAFPGDAHKRVIRCSMHQAMGIGEIIEYIQKLFEMKLTLETNGYWD